VHKQITLVMGDGTPPEVVQIAPNSPVRPRRLGRDRDLSQTAVFPPLGVWITRIRRGACRDGGRAVPPVAVGAEGMRALASAARPGATKLVLDQLSL